MRALVLERAGGTLTLVERPRPQAAPGRIVLQVRACGVCRTDLHVIDGELPDPKLPLVLGHQVVGTVTEIGAGVDGIGLGARLGLPWLGGSCGACRYCVSERENLCDRAVYTGYTADGGFAEFVPADPRYCFPIPEVYDDVEAAPLLCAGLIGWRALKLAGTADTLGLWGFGASAHIVAQIAGHQGRRVFAFTRPGDTPAQEFARGLGAEWAGGSDEVPPCELDAAIVFAPLGELVPRALALTAQGGVVVCAGIHMSDIPSFPYRLLWGERVVRSVANLTRRDGKEFFAFAPRVPVRTTVQTWPLARANEALDDLRRGRFQGAAVLRIPC